MLYRSQSSQPVKGVSWTQSDLSVAVVQYPDALAMTTVELPTPARNAAAAAALPSVSVQILNKIYTVCTLDSEVEWL